MTRRTQAIALAAAFFAAGCSTMNAHRDYNAGTDFSRLRTYAWSEAPRDTRDNLADNALMQERVRSSADAALAAGGRRKAAAGDADFTVTYHYLVEKARERPDRVRTGLGLGFGSGGTFGGASVGVGSGGAEREAETLAIDVLDGRDGKLLWHGYVTRDLRRRKDPRDAAADVDAMVRAILKEFPPKPQ